MTKMMTEQPSLFDDPPSPPLAVRAVEPRNTVEPPATPPPQPGASYESERWGEALTYLFSWGHS